MSIVVGPCEIVAIGDFLEAGMTPQDRRIEWSDRFDDALGRELELAEEARRVDQPFTTDDVDAAALRVLKRADWFPRGGGDD